MRISDWVQTWALPIYFDEQSIEVVVRSYAGGNCDVMLAGQDTEGAREPGCSIDFISFVQRQGVLMVILENLIRREMDRGMPENSIGTIRSREFRSEEHTSELQSLMRISYAVFCLKKKKTRNQITLVIK